MEEREWLRLWSEAITWSGDPLTAEELNVLDRVADAQPKATADILRRARVLLTERKS